MGTNAGIGAWAGAAAMARSVERSSLALVLAALLLPLSGCNRDASTPPGPVYQARRYFAQDEPSLATTPDTSAQEQRRIWIGYNDATELDAIEKGLPGLHNLEAISWSTDLGSSWIYEPLPHASLDPDLSYTAGDSWLASDGPTLVYTALGVHAGVTDTVALTESVDNQYFSPWRIIARASDVAAPDALTATLDKPSVDLETVPVADGTEQIAATVAILTQTSNKINPVASDIALSTAVSSSPDESAADQSWKTRLLDHVATGDYIVLNPIVRISHEAVAASNPVENLFIAYEIRPFNPTKPTADAGQRGCGIVRTTVDGTSQSPVFSVPTQINTLWTWTTDGTSRTIKDVEPMSFDIARRPTGTHLWITYADKPDGGTEHVVVADCDDRAGHRCAPDSTYWRKKTIQGRHGGDLLQPSVVADQRGQSVSLIFYENRGDQGLEPEGTIGNLAPDGSSVTWITPPIGLTIDLTPDGSTQAATFVPCPYGNQFGDYIGSTRLPLPNLTVSAWSDSRRGCTSDGNDLHVQATVW